jgi:hypothetical protein
MSATIELLPEKQQEAVHGLAAGLKKGEIAKKLQITERTLLNWRQKPAFAQALREAYLESNEALRALGRMNAEKAALRIQDMLNIEEEWNQLKPKEKIMLAFRALDSYLAKDPTMTTVKNELTVKQEVDLGKSKYGNAKLIHIENGRVEELGPVEDVEFETVDNDPETTTDEEHIETQGEV